MWTPPNFPDDAVRKEIFVSGSPDTTKYLHGLLKNIKCPLKSNEADNSLVLVYE